MSKLSDKRKRGFYIATALDENEADFIPLITDEDEDILLNEEIPEILPLLPLRNTVLFPGVVLPISVGRDKSLKLIREVYAGSKILGTVAQRDPNEDEPKAQDLNPIGTVAQILKILEMPDGSTSVIIQGKKRFEINKIISDNPFYLAQISSLDEIKPKRKDNEYEAIVGSLKDLSLRIINLSSNIPPEASFAVKNIESSAFLINFISSNSDIKLEDKQRLLEISNLKKRAILLLELLAKEVQMLELKKDIQSKVKVDIDQQQREYMLHQQMKTIQNELGGNPVEKEVEELKALAKKKKWSKEVNEHFIKETDKLIRLNTASGEYSVQLNYLQVLLDLPWNQFTKDNLNLKRAQKILDNDHFGLEKVKERIIEHLAVLKLKGDLKSPILCLVGPPGVGKTSLGKSVAKALDREYIRMSLGGLRDEAEIRGHRKTYIGAMPGRILQNLRKAKSSNPVFMLDEIDKVSRDAHGDPSSALLEVLDPEQNSTFHDNFVDVDYDLSKIMFIATANTLSTIHLALLDRMEIIDISGYIQEEKIEIARRHLLLNNIEKHGLKKTDLKLSKQVLDYIIENYTRESGVRQLDKQLAKINRVIAGKVALEEEYNVNISTADVIKILGKPRYQRDKYQGNEYAGVVTGLAWTASGGEILFIESSLSRGKGKLTLTGNLGEVMKESAVIALEYLKAHSQSLKISEEAFENWNIHIHVPEGAIPKDGPSAGITMATSLASIFTQRKIKKHLAMTGEITLRGKVLPVGGIKEKILAAKRAGIKEIILSAENEKDIDEINKLYIDGLKFHFVENIEDVLKIALLNQKVSHPLSIS
ncbi:MAG: endopeptidase La [Bacteroidales bacterium]|nr:endopeptidase La [Bacteroidales bacterium]MBN2818227.1 endopeptidase La [Bacteroidales bacterium]